MILKLNKSNSGLIIVGAMGAIAPKLLRKTVISAQTFKEKSYFKALRQMIRGLFCPTRTPYFRDEAWNWAQSLMLSSDEVKWTTLYKVHPCKRTGASKMNHFYSHIMSVGSLPASLPSTFLGLLVPLLQLVLGQPILARNPKANVHK